MKTPRLTEVFVIREDEKGDMDALAKKLPGYKRIDSVAGLKKELGPLFPGFERLVKHIESQTGEIQLDDTFGEFYWVARLGDVVFVQISLPADRPGMHPDFKGPEGSYTDTRKYVYSPKTKKWKTVKTNHSGVTGHDSDQYHEPGEN